MVARTISLLISRSISRAINELEGAAFNPLSLFAAGEQGVWYDPSDMSTLFQDAAGTIPVTAAGQPVGLMRDKSGRGNHAGQTAATSRPILQFASGMWSLLFDGVDDSLSTGNISFANTDKMTVWAGALKASDAATAFLCELSPNVNTSGGSFKIGAPNSSGLATFEVASRGTATVSLARAPFPAPITAVLCMQADIAAPSLSLRVNTTTAAPSATTQGTGNYGTWPLHIGRRASALGPFNGNLYGMIVRGAASTAEQISDTENYMNSKTGAY